MSSRVNANAAATAHSSTSIDDQADRKSSDAASSATSVVSAEALQRLAEARETWAKGKSRVFPAFYLYDKEMAHEDGAAVRCLRVSDITLIAQCIFTCLPYKAQPAHTLAAFPTLATQLYNLDVSTIEKAEKGFIASYQAYWKSCQTPFRELQVPLMFFARMHTSLTYIMEHDESFHETRELVNMDRRLKARAMLLNLLPDAFNLAEGVWKQTNEKLDLLLSKFKERMQILPGHKKYVKRVQREGEHVNFNPASEFYHEVTSLLHQLTHYTSKKLFEIRRQYQLIDFNHPESFPDLCTLDDALETSHTYIGTICGNLQIALGKFEAFTCLSCGFLPKSEAALDQEKQFYKSLKQFELAIIEALVVPVSTYLREQHITVIPVHAPSDKSKFDLFSQIIKKIILNNCDKKELDKHKNKLGDPLHAVLCQILVNFVAVVKKYRDEILSFIKNEDNTNVMIKNRLEQFGDRYSGVINIGRNTGNKFEDPLFVNLGCWIKLMEICDKVITKQLNDPNEFTEFQSAMLRNVRRPAWSSREIDEERIDDCARTIAAVNSVSISSRLVTGIISALTALQEQIYLQHVQERTADADACLELLLVEENAAAEAKRIAAEQNEKQQLTVVTAAAAAPPVVAQAPTEPPKPLLPARFHVPALQSLFEVGCAASEFYGRNPATVVLPTHLLGHPTPRHILAEYQQLYANHAFLMATEMFLRNGNPESVPVLSGMILQLGHLSLEQCMTVEHAAKFPKSFLRHDLQILLKNLGMKQGGNVWAQHASNYSLYSRYLHHFKAPLHAQAEMPQNLSQWLADFAEMQCAAMAHRDPKSDILKKVQAAVNSVKTAKAQMAPEVDQKRVGELSAAHAQVLKECEKKLNAQVESWAKTEGDKSASFLNARHHLNQLLATVRLIPQFPQQRHLHMLMHMLVFSIKNFAENFGTHLSSQNGVPIYTHVLRDLPLQDALKGNDRLSTLLHQIDIGKGDEYPFDYFAFFGKEASPVMLLLSDFYGRSLEAVLVGEGTVPAGMKAKDLPTLQGELVSMAVSFTELACALAKS